MNSIKDSIRESVGHCESMPIYKSFCALFVVFGGRG